MLRCKLLALVAFLALVSPAYAQNDPCATDCPAGEAKISFADGSQVSCSCVPEGAGMVDNSQIPGDAGVPGPNDA